MSSKNISAETASSRPTRTDLSSALSGDLAPALHCDIPTALKNDLPQALKSDLLTSPKHDQETATKGDGSTDKACHHPPGNSQRCQSKPVPPILTLTHDSPDLIHVISSPHRDHKFDEEERHGHQRHDDNYGDNLNYQRHRNDSEEADYSRVATNKFPSYNSKVHSPSFFPQKFTLPPCDA